MSRLEKIRTLNSLLLKEAPEYRQQAEQFAENIESQRRLHLEFSMVLYYRHMSEIEVLRQKM